MAPDNRKKPHFVEVYLHPSHFSLQAPIVECLRRPVYRSNRHYLREASRLSNDLTHLPVLP